MRGLRRSDVCQEYRYTMEAKVTRPNSMVSFFLRYRACCCLISLNGVIAYSVEGGRVIL